LGAAHIVNNSISQGNAQSSSSSSRPFIWTNCSDDGSFYRCCRLLMLYLEEAPPWTMESGSILLINSLKLKSREIRSS